MTTTAGASTESITTAEIVYGVRVWRILPYTQIDGLETIRLCAVGTNGIPKVWDPLVAQRAICSKHGTHHEAPAFECECGVWAANDETWAHRRLLMWMQTQGGDPVGWAIGRVALWGRVIEHEKGWRAQYAYPYALQIESEDEAVARAVRRVYAVDAEWAGAELTRSVAAKVERKRQADDAKPDIRTELKNLQEELEEISTHLNRAQAAETDRHKRWEAAHAKNLEEWVAKEAVLAAWATKHPLPTVPAGFADSEILAACVAKAAIREADEEHLRNEYSWHQEAYEDRRAIRCVRYAPSFSVDNIVDGLLILRGVEGVLGFRWPDALGEREGRDAWRSAAATAVERMMGDRLIEKGPLARYMPDADYYRPVKRLRLTRKAIRAIAALEGEVSWERRQHRGAEKTRHTTAMKPGVSALRRTPVLFEDEAQALAAAWIAEARAARNAGRKAYAEWLAHWRLEIKRLSAWHDLFTVEEIIRGVAAESKKKRRMVTVKEVMHRIAPGDYERSEVSRISQNLVKARKQGLVVSESIVIGEKVCRAWGACDAN